MSGDIIVACKIPNGVILRMHKKIDSTEPIFGGGTRSVVKYIETGQKCYIEGPAVPFNSTPLTPAVHGYALTKIDKDFWDEWLAQNSDLDMVQAGLIFAHENQDAVVGQAAEQREDKIKSGLEPLDPLALPKAITTQNDKVKLTTADEMSSIPTQVERNDLRRPAPRPLAGTKRQRVTA